MLKLSLPRQLMLGIVLSQLIALPQPVQAQFAVYDAPNHATQLEKLAEDAVHWIETIDKYRQDLEHYAQMIDNAARQLTTMQGMLGTVEETLAGEKRIVRLVSDVSRTIRGSIRLKRQLDAMINYRLQMLKSYDDRLRQGIFNPEAITRDFEAYITYTIGRRSQDTVAQLDRMARADTQLADWLDEQKKVEKEISEANATLTQAEEKLAAEQGRGVAEAANIEHLNNLILQTSARIRDLEEHLAGLKEKIATRIKQYGLRIEDMENFAFQIIAADDAWTTLNQSKDQIEATMSEMILGSMR